MDINKILENNYLKIVLGGLLLVLLVLTMWLKLKPVNNTKKIAKSEDKIYAHTDEGIVKEENLEGLKFSNISLITENDYTTFTCDVTNTSDSDINMENVDIVLKDKDDKTVITLLGNIGDTMKPSDIRTVTASAKGEFKDVVAKVISRKS